MIVFRLSKACVMNQEFGLFETYDQAFKSLKLTFSPRKFKYESLGDMYEGKPTYFVITPRKKNLWLYRSHFNIRPVKVYDKPIEFKN